jgi:radical SAM protein (TIGR01212 family)
MQRFNSYGPWLRKIFGTRVYKVSVDGGFTCPNRDGNAGWGGCTYCSNDSFRAETTDVEKSVEEQVNDGISFLNRRYHAEKFIVYWQNYSNTYAPADELLKLFSGALQSDPRIVGMAVGTRVDCVENDKLEMLRLLSDKTYVCMEYGLESIYDETLQLVKRGHDLACFIDAVNRTKKLNLPVCAHVILGFPGESREERLAYTRFLNQLDLDFVKLHHLHVVEGTPLAKEYLNRPFPVYDFDEWVEFICDFLEQLKPEIIVQRLFGWSPDDHLIAPRWQKSKAEILQAISTELENRDSWQGKALGAVRPSAS